MWQRLENNAKYINLKFKNIFKIIIYILISSFTYHAWIKEICVKKDSMFMSNNLKNISEATKEIDVKKSVIKIWIMSFLFWLKRCIAINIKTTNKIYALYLFA